VTIPPEVTPENVTTCIIDSSSSCKLSLLLVPLCQSSSSDYPLLPSRFLRSFGPSYTISLPVSARLLASYRSLPLLSQPPLNNPPSRPRHLPGLFHLRSSLFRSRSRVLVTSLPERGSQRAGYLGWKQDRLARRRGHERGFGGGDWASDERV
jgi:hypothetical protein